MSDLGTWVKRRKGSGARRAAAVWALQRRALGHARPRRSLAELVLLLSFLLVFGFLMLARPSAPFYALPLIPITLAAALYEFTGGAFLAVAATAGVGLVTALDPDTGRRAAMLRETWPLLTTYLVAGPIAGWLAAREHDRERRLASAARRLHVVHEIGQAISRSLDLDATLHSVATEVGRLVPLERSTTLLHEGDRLRIAATSGVKPPATAPVGRHVPLTGTAAGWVVRHRRAWIGRPEAAPPWSDLQDLSPPEADCVILPLQFQGRATGALALAGPGLETLAAADIEHLAQIADQAAIAIEHARLFAAERRRASQLAAISDACREIASTLDLDRTLQLVMTKAAETLAADAGALFQLEADTQAYVVKASHNLAPDQVGQVRFALEPAGGVPGWVLDHRQALNITEAVHDPRVHPRIVQAGVQSVLALPLVAREAVVGVLTLYSKTRTHAFGDQDARLAQAFADQAAVFIENARLVEELRRAAADLEARVVERTRELRDTQAQIIRAEKLSAIGRLAASVAHEVNNPLQAIALRLQLMADDGLTPRAAENLQVVQSELERIAGIVQRLLDFQRPASGDRAPHPVSALLDGVLALAQKQLQRQGVTVRRDEPAAGVQVNVVADQMKQVFLNLVLNAIDAMPHGGQLRVWSDTAEGRVAIHFSDTGVGMSPEVMAHLFEPFCSTKPAGTGLGLAISHEIVTRHGGTLEAHSRPGEGSTFVVTLPVVTGERERAEAAS